MISVSSTMAAILQHDLQRRGAKLSLAECEATLAHVLDTTAAIARRLALQAVEAPLSGRPEGST